jgi:hypothetical protein
MAEQLGKEKMVSLEELVISHAYEMVGLITVLEKKGILNRAEIIDEIKALKASEASK